MSTKRICVDMDEVMADAIAEHLLRYNQEFKSHLTKEDLRGKRFWQVVPTPHHEVLEDQLGTKVMASPELGHLTLHHLQSIPTSHPDLRLTQYVHGDAATRAALSSSPGRGS